MSGWASSSPRPSAKKDDVIKFAHSISMGESGNTDFPSPSLNARPISRRRTCAILEIRRCSRNYSNTLLVAVLGDVRRGS